MRGFHQTLLTTLAPASTERTWVFWVKQFFLFGYLQALSCVFPVIIFISLAVSTIVDIPLPRYDLMLLICIVAQVVMYKAGLETRDELLVITLFHILGVIMEFHKVRHGSWSYPEEAFTKVYGVPLYAGFMYASVGSYICQAWRNFQLQPIHWPSTFAAIVCGASVYGNFFTNAFIPDLRWYIVVVLLAVFYKTSIRFVLNHRSYHMPAIVAFVLIGFFIWLGENIATFFGAWKYAYQHKGWKMVTWHKLSSWSLLVIVSIIIVGELKKLKERWSSPPSEM